MFFSIGPKSFLQFNGKNGHNYSFNWSENNKPYADETRNLGHFHAIDISGNIELTLTKDSTQKVIVSSPNDFISKVQTKVENGVLIIYSDGILMNRSIKVTISADSIKSLVAKGACKISSDYELTATDFSVELLGASEANLNVKVTGLFNLDTKGASKVNLNGSCQTFKVNGVGASEIEATGLISKNADIHVSDASHANVYASESLNAEAYGASDIDCKGHPKTVKKSDNIGSDINVE
jgi:hypothetical protein